LRSAAVPQSVENRNAILTTDDDFAVNQARTAGERGNGCGDRGIAAGPIIPAARHQPDAGSITSRQQTEAI
jgi:hypothetical protein